MAGGVPAIEAETTGVTPRNEVVREIPAGPVALRPVTPVGIIADRMERAVELAELLDSVVGEHGVVADLLGELRALRVLAGGLEPYVEACTTPPSADLAAVIDRTRAHDWDRASLESPVAVLEAEMLSGHVEGQFLRFLVAMTGARRVLEIGMFTGYSALAIAEALPSDGQLVACEIDPGVAAFAQAGFDASDHGSKIDVRIGPATGTLERLAGTGADFDLIFIDADKAGYLGYVQKVLEAGMLAPRGTICVDNTLLQGEPWHDGASSEAGAAIREFNAAVAADPRVEQVLLPLRDGVTLIRWRW